MPIREAKPSDINDLVKLKEEMAKYHEKIDPDFYETNRDYKKEVPEMFRENSKVFIYEENGKIVGYIWAEIRKGKRYMKEKRIGYISELFVLEKFRRKGIGKELLKTAINWLRKEEIRLVLLSVDVRNKIGVNFWRSQGFEEYMLRMRKYI